MCSERYDTAFLYLYGATIKIALEKIRKRKEIINEKRKLMTNHAGHTVYYIDFFFDLIDKLFEIYEPASTDSEEVVNLKVQTFKTIEQELNKIYECKEYQEIQSNLKSDLTPEKLKMYFK